MKLIFVHGIHQEKKVPDDLKKEWINALNIDASDVNFPYYGDLLGDLTYKHTGKYRDLSSQTKDTSLDKVKFDQFAQPIIAEMRQAHSDTSNLSEESSPRGKGIHKTKLKKIARSIENISPFDGHFALKLLKQAYAYLSIQEVYDNVNSVVRQALLGPDPKVVVSHSLGTIVSYVVMLDLHKKGQLPTIPLFMTLGSPLSLKIVMKKVSKDAEQLHSVLRWVNVADKEDFIALGNALDSHVYKMNIENIVDVDNGYEDPHSILKYLSHSEVGEVIASSLL